MATRKANTQPLPAAGPIVAVPVTDVLVTAPDTSALTGTYTTELLPQANLIVNSDETYAAAKMLYVKAKQYISNVESLLANAKKTAHEAHKALTTLENSMCEPGRAIQAHLTTQILAYEDHKRRLAEEETRRIAAEMEAERRRLEAIALEEHRKKEEAARAEAARIAAEQEAERQAKLAALEAEELAPWEIEDAMAVVEHQQAATYQPPIPVYVPPPPPPPAPITVAPALPFVAGGANSRFKPWQAEVVDFHALVKAAAADPSLLVFLEANLPALNKKAVEHGEELQNVIPGVRAKRDRIMGL
jgi:hypothetical protein